MKLHQLRYLAAVAQCGLNITAAAQKLHTSQPGVSKQIKLLEDELGFQIFVREGRNLTRITPAGQQVIDRALRILALAHGGRLTLKALAAYPIVTYTFSFAGPSSLQEAFAKAGLTANVAITARDSDVIKTYVRLGLGVGIVAHMAIDEEDTDL